MTKKEQQIFDAYKSDVAIFKSKVVDLTMENEEKDQRIAELGKQLENATKEIDYLEFQLREQYQIEDRLECDLQKKKTKYIF